MRVTVCQLDNEAGSLDRAWRALAEHLQTRSSELVLLPEMPFAPWPMACSDVDEAAWSESVRVHDAWLGRLGELGAACVIGTRPVVDGGRRFNETFVWTRDRGSCEPGHRKCYLPDEPGFYEATWYDRGDGRFEIIEALGVRIGMAICTEVWFGAHARAYGEQGVHLLLTPRATLSTSTDKWLAGGRTAAVVSGAYSLSSNFSGAAGSHGRWGGTGWIIDPEEGDVLGMTSGEAPFLTVDIDPSRAEAAKRTYPRYVLGPGCAR